MLQPKYAKQLDSNIKELIANGGSNEDVDKMASDYTSLFSNEALKKKENSTGTSPSKKLASGATTGSSAGVNSNGFPKIDTNSVAPGVGMQAKSESSVAKPTLKKETKTKIVDSAKPKEDNSFLDYLADNLSVGLNTVSKSLYDAPGLIYDAAASFTNPVFEAMGVDKDKLASSDKLANDLGFKNIPSEILQKKIKDTNTKINEYSEKNGGDALAALENGNYLGAAKLVAGTTVQSLPIMVAAMASGGQTAALTAIGVSTASTKNAQLKEEHPEMDLSTRVTNSATSGLIEAVTGHLFTGASGAVMKKIIADKGVEAGSKIISKSFTSTIQKAIEKNPFVGALGEVVEETAVEFGNQANDIASGIRNEFDIHAIKNAGLSATGMGGINTLGVYGAKGYIKAKDYNQIKSVNKEVFKLRNELSKDNISEDNKKLIGTRIDRLVLENKKLLGGELEKLKSLPIEIKKELNTLNSDFESIKDKIEDIKEDSSLSNDVKVAMLDELKVKAEATHKRKTEILSTNENAVIDQDFSNFDGVEPDFNLENGKISSLPIKEQDRINDLAVNKITGGDKTVEYTKEQVSQVANEIYANEKNTQAEAKQEVVKDYKIGSDMDVPTMTVVENGGEFLIGNYTPQSEGVNPSLKAITDLDENTLRFKTKEEAEAKLSEIQNPPVVEQTTPDTKAQPAEVNVAPSVSLSDTQKEEINKLEEERDGKILLEPQGISQEDLVKTPSYISNREVEAEYNVKINKIINEAAPQSNLAIDGNVPVGNNPEAAPEQNNEVQPTAKAPTNKGEVGAKLIEVNKRVFRLDDKKSNANAVVMEKTIETMAERAGISKEAMFDKIDFQKGDAKTAEKLSKKGKALFQIVGENADLSDTYRQNLVLARELESKGKAEKEIWVATGWQKGADGKWRAEIDDSKMKLHTNFTGMRGNTLKEAIQYDDLFELYPDLKNVKVSVIPNLRNMNGAYIPNKNLIMLNGARSEAEIRSTLLHEIQHIVQAKEGFAIGGMPKIAEDYLRKKMNRIQIAKNIPKGLAKAAAKLSSSLFEGVNIESSKEQFNLELEKAKRLLSKDEFDLYQSIAGEVESRNVQQRIDMTAEERRATPLSETEDVARDEQIVLFQGEQGAMLAEDGKFIIYALTDPNVSTPLHEIAHVYEHYLTDAERTTILKDAGHTTWSRETSEHFARGFEKYLADGIAPSPEMKSVFDNFKKWMTEIYNGITASDIDIKLSPEMKKIYDTMLGAKETLKKTVKYKSFGKETEFTVETDSKGEVRIFKKDGTEVPKYTQRKLKKLVDNKVVYKPAKNANYFKILAIAEGGLSDNEINLENKKQIQESINNFIPTSEYEFALLEIANGAKFSKESIQKEVGNLDSKWATDQFTTKKLPSIEKVAEAIVSSADFVSLDEQEVRNHLIDIIASFGGINDVKESVHELYKKSIDPFQGMNEQEAIAANKEFITEAEQNLFETVEAEDNLTESEKLKYYQNEYEKSIESLTGEQQRELYDQNESDRQGLPDPNEGNANGNNQEGNGKQEEKVILKEKFNIDGKEIFYHASDNKRNGRLKLSNAPQFGTGVYFSTNKELVENEYGDENTTIAKLNIKNPVYTGSKEWTEVESLAIEKADIDYGTKKELKLAEDETYFRYDKENLSEIDEIPSKFISDAAKELGYDAIIDKGSSQYENEVVVLDESKIEYKEENQGIDDKSTPDQILEWLENAEKELDAFGRENLSVGIPIVVAKTAIQAMKLAVKAGKLATEIIQAGLDAVIQSDWFKNLTQTEQSDIENDFQTNFLNKITAIDPANERQAENLLNRAASESISEDDAYADVKATFDQARTELINKKLPAEYIRDAYRNFVKRFTDRQYLAKSLLNKSGMKAVQNLIINSHGASGKAKIQFEEAYNKIYKSLTTKERATLDEIIQAKRFIAIDSNREARGLEPVSHPNFIDKNKSEKFLSKLEKELGTEKYNDLVKRADAYFDTYKGLLKEMLDNGLISRESFDSMSDVDYQPRVFLQFVTDFNGDLETTKRTNNIDSGGLSSEQIKSMSEGDANSLVLNSEWLLTNSLLSRSKAMAMNNINKRFMTGEFQAAKKRFDALDPKNLKGDDVRFYKYFKELSSKVIENPIIGQTDSGNSKHLFDKTPANFAKAYYYVNGQRNEFFLEKELHESWNDNVEGIFSSGLKEFLSYASGAALVKAIATGNNPAFPIVNTPRDFLFTATFSDQYSNIVPKAMIQIAKDVVKSIREIRKPQSDVLKKYLEYGGAMDFLSSQGTLKKESVVGQVLEKAVSANTRDIAKSLFSKVTLHKISQYSEMMFRLGIFQRAIQNQLKELGLNDISEVTDKQQLDDIYNQAVSSARSILDFNQGGAITKDLESVIPYINVAFQGGRVAAGALEKDPVGTTARILQVATLASSVPIGLSLALISAMKSDDDDDKSAYEIYLHAMDGVSRYQKMKYMNIVTGNKNDEGEYQVIKVAKAQELTPVMSVTDDIYANFIRSIAGKQKKSASGILDDALFTFNSNVMPIDVTSPAGLFTRTPIIKGTLSYLTGFDFFREEPLSSDIGKVPKPVEGITMSSTEDFYKKLGENYGLSPIRSKAFVESLITGPSTNPFVGMLYGGADAATSDKDMKQIGGELFKTIYKSTGKRVISYSSDFNRQLTGKKELQEKIDAINMDKYRTKADFNKLTKQFSSKQISKEDLDSKLNELEPIERKRMINKIQDKKRMSDVDGTILDIKYEQGNEVKALMIMHYYGDIFDGSKDSKAVLRQMKKAKGILTPATLQEYNKIKKQLGNEKRPE